jgi:hypothetical protein
MPSMWYESSVVTEAVVIVTADVDHRGTTLVRGFGHRQSEALAQIHHADDVATEVNDALNKVGESGT